MKPASRWLLVYATFLAAVACTSGQMSHDHSTMTESMNMNANMTTTSTASPCVLNPGLDSCKDFTYPTENITADNDALCKAMPFMTACSVRDVCARTSVDQKLSETKPVCDGFSLLATTCAHDGMSGMHGCANYNKLCAPGSKVSMCTAAPPLSFLPTTRDLNTRVRSICNEMSMDGCEKCTPSWSKGQTFGNCSLLEVYSQLCTAMPDMGQCDAWKSMCSADSTFFLCPGGGKRPSGGGSPAKAPVMKMYFNSERPFYLLFRAWTPATDNQYVGAWFAIFFLGVLFEALQVVRYLYDKKLAPLQGATQRPVATRCCADLAGKEGLNGAPLPVRGGGSCCDGAGCDGSEDGHTIDIQMNGTLPKRSTDVSNVVGGGGNLDDHRVPIVSPAYRKYGLTPSSNMAFSCGASSLLVDLGRATLTFCSVCLSYLLMLAAMSFNVGIFFAVAAGIAVGSVLLGRFRAGADKVGEECCMV